MRKLDTDAMLGRASPRNPKELMCQRSSILVILLVAWRVTASSSSAAGMPRAVVPDPDEALPAVFQRDLDQRCSGVEAVFHKFFDYACGTFHDFTGCDLIAQFG